MSGVSTLSTVKHTLTVNGAVVHTLHGGTQGPEGIQGPIGDVAATTHAATSKATPVDADEIPLSDSAATWGLKKLTWANLKATLKAYFDSLYLTTIAPLVVASANVVEQRNGSAPQTFRLANTYTSASIYEFGFVRWASSVFEIGAEAAGGGSSRAVRIRAGSASPVYIYAGGSDRWEFTLSGHQKPASANAYDVGDATNTVRTGYFGTSIQVPQIKFPATQSASSDPNTLDDYEEGTFTPTLTGTVSSAGITYTAQVGAYVKVGSAVHYALRIVVSSMGTASGSVQVAGFPFAARNTVGLRQAVTVRATNLTGISGHLQGYIVETTTAAWIEHATTGASAILDVGKFTATSEVFMSGTYFTA